MSGIVGIYNLDGRPVDPQLLWRMTNSLAFRGPDAQDLWRHGEIGFGHAMLHTTDESAREHQPCSLDGQVWITADARIDGRAALIQKLRPKVHEDLKTATDVELILHAYDVWGERCVEHLLGDFVFALWDERRQRLFCARDQFGVKPFFYAQVGGQFVFSNTLDCVRLHPAVSAELNEQAIGDFLLFDGFQDLALTAFADIQRLPPAHTLLCAGNEVRVRRYWRLPDGDLIQYRRQEDYLEQLLELLQAAVGDRLRTARVSVLMSGGLDSAAVAASARAWLAEQTSAFQLEAHTAVYDRLFPDEERHYAGLVAAALNLPIHFFVADDYLPYAGWDSPKWRQPEPVNNPFLQHFLDLTQQAGERQRVVLTGSDGDTFFFELPNWYFSDLFKQRRFGRLLVELARYTWTKREAPRVGFRAWLRQRRGGRVQTAYPVWLNPDFAARLKLPERWAEHHRARPQHSVRPRLYRVLNAPMWSQHFESHDAGVSGMPVEYRHPLADLRLLEFTLRLPPAPWLVKKELLRRAMRERLPPTVCARPKASLAGNPFSETLRDPRSRWIDRFEATPLTERFVERAAIPPCIGEPDMNRLWMNARPLSLNYWLAALAPANHSSQLEERNEYQHFNQVGQAG